MCAHLALRAVERLILATSVAVCLFLILCSAAVCQTEEGMVENARIKIKLKEYDTAEAILKEALKKYPSSVEVAETLAKLYEQTKKTEELVEAYNSLIRILQLKEVNEKSLSAKESALLKETQKKLTELVRIRTEADAAILQFSKDAQWSCKRLALLKRYAEASYIFQRLCSLKVDEEEVKKVAELLGQENAQIMKRPESDKGDTETAQKLLLEAQKLFKGGKLDEACVTCKAALEADPGQAAAVALLYDIKEKMGKTEEMLVYGLSYLLFPADDQSAARAEEIEKCFSKSSDELKSFFEATKKCADQICSLTRKAIREKRENDLRYAVERLVQVSHRTKKVDSILSEASAFSGSEGNKLVQIGKLLVSDDFSKPSNLWYQREGYAFYENGRFIVKSDLEMPFLPRYSVDFKPNDFYAEFEIELIGEAKALTAGGLCFHVESNSTYYAVMISPDGNFGAWLINKGVKKDLTGREKGDSSTLACSVPSKYIKRGKSKNTIAVAFVGNKLFCYLNKALVFTCEENSRIKGTVGFIANKGNNAYAFDNFKVYEVSLPEK